MLKTCPHCDSPLLGKREVVFEDVVVNARGELFSAREVDDNWTVTCAQGHEIDVMRMTMGTDGSLLAVKTRRKAPAPRGG